MNWDINKTLELLSHSPADFGKHNLETIQAVIDNDKYIGSSVLNCDLCGQYAPFCAFCDKSIGTPCAVAYIKSRRSEELEIEEENKCESIVNKALPDETSILSETCSDCDTEKTVSRRVRIATAKRKK